MNEQQPQQQQDPQITYTDPTAYILYLRTRGLNAYQIDDLVRRRFGPGTTQEQRQRQQQRSQENAQLAQTGGMVAGAVAGTYIMNHAGEWINKFTGEKVTEEVVKQAAQQSGQQMAQSGTMGLTRQVPPSTTTVDGSSATVDLNGGTPEVISSQNGVSTVKTPAGTQDVPNEALNDPSFWSAVNWQQVAQGGLALAQMYQAYKSYKEGNYTGAGIYGAAGAGSLAAATGAVATGEAAGTMGSYVIPGLNILAGAYGGYQTAEALGNMAAGKQRMQTGVVGGAASGAALGSYFGPYGTAIGAAVGAVAGGAGAYFGSSKKKPQMTRDAIRGVLQKGGILDEKWQGTLADGTTYDFGKDGSTLKWKNIDKIADAQPAAWNASVPAADALAASYGFVGQKASDIAAWYAKGAVSNANNDPNIAIANMQHFAKQQGITMNQIKEKLDSAIKDNRINQGQYDYYMQGANTLLGGGQTTPKASQTTTPIARPKTGEVGRQSAGLYRDDKGRLVRASTMRGALERAYNKGK